MLILPLAAGTLLAVMFLQWWERRLLGWWQDRQGPNRVGWFGILQGVADGIKFITKDDWLPPFGDRVLFTLAPVIVAASMLLILGVIPFAPDVWVVDLNIALLWFLAMSSLAVYGVLLGGFASNNKYALLGSLRAAAQMVTYEVFMGLSIMGVVIHAGSFSLVDIVEAQADLWFIVPQFLGFVIFFIAGLAESHRLPFDLPEAEHELTGGFPYRVLGYEIRVRDVRRIRRHDRHLLLDHAALLRRLACVPHFLDFFFVPPHRSGSASRCCSSSMYSSCCGRRFRGLATTS